MRRKCIVSLIIVIFAVCMTSGVLAKDRNPLEKVDKYKIYYDDISSSILNDMGSYDMVIVEGMYYKKDDVNIIKNKNNTMVMGYLSVMEVGNWDEEVMKKMIPEDYLVVNGKMVINKEYNNPLGDISQKHYREVLIDIIKERIVNKGMDGVFLDTVGWIDDYRGNSQVYGKLRTGYQDFLKEVRKQFPKISIIQNRGFTCFYDFSCKYVNGLLWEDFDIANTEERAETYDIISKLQKIRKSENTVIFSVSFKNEGENRAFARKIGWKHLQLEDENAYSIYCFNK